MSDLDKRVLEAIEKRGLAPRPYAYFLAKRSVFWTLAALSIVLGAIAVAVLMFAVSDYYATGGRNFDEMPLDDLFETLPYVWLVTLGLLIASAYFGLRNTPGNYRYRPSYVVAAAVLATVVLGGLLHYLELGQPAHQYLKENVPLYERLVFGRSDKWRDPDKGYLGGHVLSYDKGKSLTLRDFQQREWTVDISGATLKLEEALEEEEDVAIRGVRTGPTTFRARLIEEWD